MIGLKTYQAECWTKTTCDPTYPSRNEFQMALLVAAKPNLMRYDSWITLNSPPISVAEWKAKCAPALCSYISDGKTIWQQSGPTYRKDKVTDPKFLGTNGEPWSDFYSQEQSLYSSIVRDQKQKNLLAVRHAGREIVDGILCDKIFTHVQKSYDNGEVTVFKTTYYFAVSDRLLRRRVMRIEDTNGIGLVRDATLRHIVVNAPVANAKTRFSYQPPEGVRLESTTTRVPNLLPEGTLAPNFTATDKEGKTVTLSDFRGKVVILDFWASWCPPCVASMPHNQAVAKKLQSENLPVILLALDNFEDRGGFLKWVNRHKEMDAIYFIHADPKKAKIGDKLYPTAGIPTQYIIDAKGIIRDSIADYTGPTSALEKSVRQALKTKK
jgi:thiol-disulfide isomerase/thioredoxin